MRAHYKFWPKRLPHAITLPVTSLWDNLETNARRYPNKAALVFFGTVLTYIQLLQKAEQLAQCLHYITDPDARVAITTADLAAELAQASNALDAKTHLSHLIITHFTDAFDVNTTGDDAPPTAWNPWLTTRHLPPTLQGGQVLDWTQALAAGGELPALQVGPADLAILPYTSGTTGLPKGCMHTHASIMHNAVASGIWGNGSAENVVLVVVPMFHITGMVSVMHTSIRGGATLVIMPRWDSDQAVAQRLLEQYGLRYVEGYGLTETAAPSHSNPPDAPKQQCLGIPFMGTDARVVDPDTLQEVPQGTSGEIVIHGPEVFQGYWKRPQATEAAFFEMDGKRFFRSGDIGMVDEDGYFFLTDRLKRMINASGFKVWPAEVEALMYRHPAIAEACIISTPDSYRGESVKAVVVLRPSHRDLVTEQEIADWCRENMAVYKVPRVVQFVDALPKSGAGKVMWRTLQESEGMK